MYNSLLEWCRFPVEVHHRSGFDVSGEAKYDKMVIYKGYRVDEMQVITDKTGKEYVSRMKIYFPPSVDVSEDDKISFKEAPEKREIRKLGGFSDGNTGQLSIIVVYL